MYVFSMALICEKICPTKITKLGHLNYNGENMHFIQVKHYKLCYLPLKFEIPIHLGVNHSTTNTRQVTIISQITQTDYHKKVYLYVVSSEK